ncbi:DUF3306 domain-containing protein [Photobacterium damselae subsp. damselae]|uniref:DUF3306 domain-containing protein n=1 Tax=Photobacterium damselae TaxID=38293 RepID=UPI001F1E5359|nr:DUF3306 domain-containing protein [Photobacterium damselae]UKA24144.1 DUF3306 domain-containing protein [Photobacterium damselae subsp. damselae]
MTSNFFQRWSSRKLTAREETPQVEEKKEDSVEIIDDTVAQSLSNAHIDEANASSESTSPCEQSDTSVLDNSVSDNHSSEIDTEVAETEDLTLSDVDKVTFESGAASFLKQGVDKAVKKAALRKLFHSSEYNYISDMDDCIEDFSQLETLSDKVKGELRSWAKEQIDDLLTPDNSQSQAQPAELTKNSVDSSEQLNEQSTDSELSLTTTQTSADSSVESLPTESTQTEDFAAYKATHKPVNKS